MALASARRGRFLETHSRQHFRIPDHSISEQRFLTIGTAAAGGTMVVSHTEADNKIRIICARAATRSERRFYEESR
jgi:uncharacterized DUF497 family protein